MGILIGGRAAVPADRPHANDQDADDRRRPLHDRQELLRQDREVRPPHGHLGRREPR